MDNYGYDDVQFVYTDSMRLRFVFIILTGMCVFAHQTKNQS